MIYFVECFAEVQEDGVCLSFVVESLSEVPGSGDELCFAVSSFSEAVLEGYNEVVGVKVSHDAAVYYEEEVWGEWATLPDA